MIVVVVKNRFLGDAIYWEGVGLGERFDREIAEEIGRPVSTVAMKRRGLGIASFQRRRKGVPREVWDAIDIGERTDVEIAEELKTDPSCVLRERRRRGIPRYLLIQPGSPESALLGTENDPTIAAKLGISAATVRNYRVRLGIPRLVTVVPRSSVTIESIGKYPDTLVGKALGRTRQRIFQIRKEKGVPRCSAPYCSFTLEES